MTPFSVQTCKKFQIDPKKLHWIEYGIISPSELCGHIKIMLNKNIIQKETQAKTLLSVNFLPRRLFKRWGMGWQKTKSYSNGTISTATALSQQQRHYLNTHAGTPSNNLYRCLGSFANLRPVTPASSVQRHLDSV